MAPKRQNPQTNLSEMDKMQLHKKVADFIASGETKFLVPNLSKVHRKYLHQYAARFGLKTQSFGKQNNRCLQLMHRRKLVSFGEPYMLKLPPEAQIALTQIDTHVSKCLHEEHPQNTSSFTSHQYVNPLLIDLGSRMIPPWPNRISNELYREKIDLPIHRYKNQIIEAINTNSVFIVNGETGSGKSTQIPQYILNEATRCNRSCRIFVTQPRRVAAVSVAHRVAEERGEKLGNAVGYHIRMEKCMSKTTNLIYTTSGWLLRTIMADSSEIFRKITHLIIDEIHERDKNTDFTLIAVKEYIKHNKDLKVILMSATMDIHLLSSYFDDCPVLNVPGQSYDVKIYHLEDILYHTGYRTLLMGKYLRLMNSDDVRPVPFENANVVISDPCTQEIVDYTLDICCEPSKSPTDAQLWEVFDQLQYFIESEGVPVDAVHSKTGVTALIAACKANCPKYVQTFLQLQANVRIRDQYGRSACDYAAEHVDGVCLQLLHGAASIPNQMEENTVDVEKKRLLSAYQSQFSVDQDVDHDLILSLLEGLYRTHHPGAIMVFLPGYNDIIAQRDLITSTLPSGTYVIYILHGHMDSNDQYRALLSHGVRKIILSTNIGQTSITIPDLAFIIDSGKIKLKTFDCMTESSQLQSVWISQADASQRSGRAGRTQNGVCYRLYSTDRYHFMSKFCIPEFMRIPLTEICLFAKTLDHNSEVQAFMSRALNPPSAINVQNAIKKLQILEVFNDDESVTELGKHLVEIPVDVHLGKCLVYSVFLKCIDPIITIVAFHSIKDPFILPTDRTQQGQASFLRKSFAGKSFSDHKGILALYDAYTKLRNKKKLQDFCNKYYLSKLSMDMFLATRRQICELVTKKFRVGVNATLFNNDWNMVRLCLVAGFYPNVAFIDRSKPALTSGAENQLILQRTSALTPPGLKNLKDFVDMLPHDWIIFYEKSRLSNLCTTNMNTVVSPILIALQCGRQCVLDEVCDADTESSDEDSPNSTSDNPITVSPTHNKRVILALDNWIKFDMDATEAKSVLYLRQFMRDQFNEFLKRGHTKQTSVASLYMQMLLTSLPDDCTKEKETTTHNTPTNDVRRSGAAGV